MIYRMKNEVLKWRFNMSGLKDFIKNIFKFLKPKSELSLPAPIETKEILSEGKVNPSKYVVPNYYIEIQNAKSNLVDAYRNWNYTNNQMNERNETYKEEYGQILQNINSVHKTILAARIKSEINNIVATNKDVVSRLMDKSTTIDDIYASIKANSITVNGPSELDDNKIRRIGTEDFERFEKIQNSQDQREFKTAEEHNDTFEEAILYVMSHRIEGKQEGYNIIAKDYTEEEISEIKGFIELVSKYQLESLKYILELNKYKGEGFGTHFALIQALSPNLVIPQDIAEQYKASNTQEYQERALKDMNELISNYIKAGMEESLGKEATERAVNLFKSQITDITGLVAGSKSEEEFLQKFGDELKDPNMTPLRMFLGHLWSSSRSISLGNKLSQDFVALKKRENGDGLNPAFIKGERIKIESQQSEENLLEELREESGDKAE